VDSGTGLIASHIQHIVQDDFAIVYVLNHFPHKPGACVTATQKEDMFRDTQTALKADTMNILANFVTTHPGPEILLEDFKHQLLSFRLRTKSEVYKGERKHGDGGCDDMIWILMRAMRAKILFAIRYNAGYNAD
jgi:hypothetical protein